MYSAMYYCIVLDGVVPKPLLSLSLLYIYHLSDNPWPSLLEYSSHWIFFQLYKNDDSVVVSSLITTTPYDSPIATG